ncbi:MAG: beta-glucosidase [Chloroflexaceae bacterium]|nr:beta-glucosidase [Chloroflexaceae bacterium]NJO07020.1 beta-glucosidase [Chloroflexaceae bacterium]
MTQRTFPRSFVWGAATSSYQIEGGWNADGRGESIWDRFSHTPGKIEDGSTGDVACDHYHRWREDVALMQELGLQAYRFSIAWPRILPEGCGQVNQAGLDFYKRLVDALLEAGITPVVTLYHWDLPQTLEDAGGWPARSVAEIFVEYADLVSRELGDRVKHWITHNEPWVMAFLGYEKGSKAPGITDMAAALVASHHLLLAHGWAVPVLRQNSPGAEVGITVNLSPTDPASPSQYDADAARHFDGYMNRWFLDPLYGRGYPADMIADYQQDGYLPAEGMPFVQQGDLDVIATPTDFLGVNYYSRAVLRSDRVPEATNEPRTIPESDPAQQTDMGWEVYAPGLYNLLMRLHTDYQINKLYITENGASYSDGPNEKGVVRDMRRLHFLYDHFTAAHRAISAGVPLAGYFVWSLFDNFEWEQGYAQRFGIVWVDYTTQQRIPKESARWYSRVIASNAVSAELPTL